MALNTETPSVSVRHRGNSRDQRIEALSSIKLHVDLYFVRLEKLLYCIDRDDGMVTAVAVSPAAGASLLLAAGTSKVIHRRYWQRMPNTVCINK